MAMYFGWTIDAIHDGENWNWNDKSRDGFKVEIDDNDVLWKSFDSKSMIKRLKELGVISESADESQLFVDDSQSGSVIEIMRLDEDYKPVYALIQEDE